MLGTRAVKVKAWHCGESEELDEVANLKGTELLKSAASCGYLTPSTMPSLVISLQHGVVVQQLEAWAPTLLQCSAPKMLDRLLGRH